MNAKNKTPSFRFDSNLFDTYVNSYAVRVFARRDGACQLRATRGVFSLRPLPGYAVREFPSWEAMWNWIDDRVDSETQVDHAAAMWRVLDALKYSH